MGTSKSALEEFSGYLGVGSLELLGIFFILDGTHDFLGFVERFAQTNAWAILVSVPLLVVAHVLGLVSSLAVDSLIKRIFRPILTPKLFAQVALSSNQLLIQRYVEADRNSRLLYGCALAFMLVAIGSRVEVGMMQECGVVGYIGFGSGLAGAVVCPYLARRLQSEIVDLTNAILSAEANPSASPEHATPPT